MPICPKCGKEVEEGMKYCLYCGGRTVNRYGKN